MANAPMLAYACIHCGRRIESDAAVCLSCGTDQRTGVRLETVVERAAHGGHAPSRDEDVFEKEDVGLRFSPGMLLHWFPVMTIQLAVVLTFWFTARGDLALQGPYRTFVWWYLGIAAALVLLDAVMNSEWEDVVIDLLLPRLGCSVLLNAENPYFLSTFACAFGACLSLIGLR